METLMIKSKSSFQHFLQSLNISTPSTKHERRKETEPSGRVEFTSPGAEPRQAGDAVTPTAPPPTTEAGGLTPTTKASPIVRHTMDHNQTTIKPREDPFAADANFSTAYAENTTGDYFPNYWTNSDEGLSWNGSYFTSNGTNYTALNISDFELLNVNNSSVQYGFWFCAKWVEAQQDLFQAANLCFAVAFLIPKSFKQSILIVRALAAAGFLLLAAWAGTELCSPDVLAWNIVLVVVNSIHTILLIIRLVHNFHHYTIANNIKIVLQQLYDLDTCIYLL